MKHGYRKLFVKACAPACALYISVCFDYKSTWPSQGPTDRARAENVTQ